MVLLPCASFGGQIRGAFYFCYTQALPTRTAHTCKCAQLLDATVCSELCYLFSDEADRTRRRTKNKATKRAKSLSSPALSSYAWLCSFTTGLQPKLRDARAQLLRVIPSVLSACAYAYRSRKEGCVVGIDLSLSISLSLSSIALYLSDKLAKETSDTRRKRRSSNEVCLGRRRHHGRSHCATEEDLISLSQPFQETRPTASRPPDKPRVPALRIS